jgi:catalase
MKKQVALLFAGLLAAQSLPGLAADIVMTRNSGAPVGDNQNSQTAGPWGPTLLQDTHLLEKLAAFDRERIPERVVHARGVGAHGVFTCVKPLTDLTTAVPFQTQGKQTPVFTRFSTVINAQGSPDTLRDPRGFAVRFFTEQGNWDLVGNNLPVFFIRDAMKFPDLIHSLKPSPVTNLQDPNRYFDFLSHVPESTAMVTHLFSDFGTPATLRHTDGFGVHAFKFVNAKGQATYVKFNWRTKQGVKNHTAQQVETVSGKDFNYHLRDMTTAIKTGDHPSWDLYIQSLKPEQLNRFDFNPLDTTKIWPTEIAPEVLVGTMTLNRMPKNFFNETERYAPAPSNLIPGIEPSEDRMLQGRLFSYADTQRYRLGINHQLFPINHPRVPVQNHNVDGEGQFRQKEQDVNYQPSRRSGLTEDTRFKAHATPVSGTVQQIPFEKTQNFKQAGDLYRGFSDTDKTNLISNLKGEFDQIADPEIKLIWGSYLYKADADYGTRFAQATGIPLDAVKQRAALLKD